MTVKFSQFSDGEQLQVNDTVVGLRDGVNTKFDFPSDGFKDQYGNYLVGYSALSNSSSCYWLLQNNDSSGPATFTAYSASLADVDALINTTGTGNISLSTTSPGYVNINGSQFSSVNSISNYFRFAPQTGGQGPTVYSEGSSTTVTIDLWTKNAYVGVIGNPSTIFKMFNYSDTSISAAFNTASLTAARTYTFPDATGTIMLTSGTALKATNLAGGTANQIPYQTAPDTTAFIASGNNGALVTGSGGVPSISSTLPAAVQANITTVGTVTSGTWSATTIAINKGGTNSTAALANGLLMVSNAGAIVEIASSVSASGQKITSLGTPTASGDAATKGYVDSIVTAGLVLQGNWDASTNTPTLTAGIGTIGYYYYVSVAGTQTLPSGVSTSYSVGDRIIYGANAIWNKITATGLTSINGASGSLTLQGTANQIIVGTVGQVITLSTPQNIATSSTPTFAGATLTAAPNITTGLNDVNGNKIIGFTPTVSAVNYLNITNSGTGGDLPFNALGLDDDIGISYRAKGEGRHIFNGGTSSIQVWVNGADSTKHVAHDISELTDSRAVTWPDLSGSAILTGCSGSAAALTTPNITTGINDVNGNRILGFSAIPSAVNYINITNNTTGQQLILSAAGADPNINFLTRAKGKGGVIFEVDPDFAYVSFRNINDATKSLNNNFSAVSTARTVTWSDTSGTVILSNSSGQGVLSSPVNSSTVSTNFGSSLTSGTSKRNTLGYNILLNICVRLLTAGTGSINLGVSSSSTPTTSKVVSTSGSAVVYTFSAIVPNNYYILVSSSDLSISTIACQACGV